MSKVVFVCPIYNSYPAVIASLIMQRHQDWELLLIHDGPGFYDPDGQGSRAAWEFNDPRIHFSETPERRGLWGHPIRRETIEKLGRKELIPGCTHVVVTNPDNYHLPCYCDKMLAGFDRHPRVAAVYCESILHNYIDWNLMPSKIERGSIDTAGFMATIEAAASVGWFSDDHSADWFYMEALHKKYGSKNVVQVGGCLAIHN
jgi:hypothetical protein